MMAVDACESGSSVRDQSWHDGLCGTFLNSGPLGASVLDDDDWANPPPIRRSLYCTYDTPVACSDAAAQCMATAGEPCWSEADGYGGFFDDRTLVFVVCDDNTGTMFSLDRFRNKHFRHKK